MSWPQRSKTWPCGLAKPIGDVDVELLRPRLIAIHARVGVAPRRTPRRLDLRVMERSFLEIEGSARIEHEAVGRVMRVGRIEPVKHPLFDVVPCRRRWCPSRNSMSGPWATITPPFQNSKPVGLCRSSAKTVHLSARPSPSVSSRISSLSFIASVGFQCGYVVPDGDPQPARVSNAICTGVGQLGKLLLGGEQVDLHPLVDGHLARSPPRRSRKMCLPPGSGPGLFVIDRNERRQIRVVGLDVFSLCSGPHDLVAVGGQQVDHFQLALHDFVVGLPVDEPQKGPVAVGRVAVGRAVAVEPVPVLVVDGGAQLFDQFAVKCRRARRSSPS